MDDRKINDRCSEVDVSSAAARGVRVQAGCAPAGCSVGVPAALAAHAFVADAAFPWRAVVAASASSVAVALPVRVDVAAFAIAPGALAAPVVDGRAVALPVRVDAVVPASAPGVVAPVPGAAATGCPPDAVAALRVGGWIVARVPPVARRASVPVWRRCVAVRRRDGSPARAATCARRDARSARWAIRPDVAQAA